MGGNNYYQELKENRLKAEELQHRIDTLDEDYHNGAIGLEEYTRQRSILARKLNLLKTEKAPHHNDCRKETYSGGYALP